MARLREAGSVLAEPDPADRRRQLLARNPTPTARQREVAAIDIAPTVAAALSTDEPAALNEVLTALETVARHLRPHR